MNPNIDPDEAIKKIDVYLMEIEALLQMPQSQGYKIKTQLEIKIKGFVRVAFKDNEAKLRDYDMDRFSQIALEKTKQRKYIVGLEITKSYLLTYKEELELLNCSRKRKWNSSQYDPAAKSHPERQNGYSITEIRAGGVTGIIISIIFGIMAYTSYPNLLAVAVIGIFSLALGILGVGCFIKPDDFGPILLLWLEKIGRANSTAQGTNRQNQSNPRNSPQIINTGGNVTVNIREKSTKQFVEDNDEEM